MFIFCLFSSYMFNSRRQPLNGYFLGAFLFLQFEEFELYWCAVLKISSHIFMIFEV